MRIKYLASLVTFALLLSGATFAKETNAGKFDLTQQARIGHTVLKPGNYKAEWTGPENALKISILQGNKIVASTSGAITELPKPAPYSAVTVRTKTNHSTVIEQIEFNNRREELNISGS